jgi:hypothetical protein
MLYICYWYIKVHNTGTSRVGNNLLSQKLQQVTCKEKHLKQTWLERCWDDPLENLPMPILIK